MTTINKKTGFTAVELMITLFIAALFLVSGYQLYNVIVKDGGQTRSQARASNVAYDYLQRYKSNPTFIKSSCVVPAVQTPLTNSSSIPNLSKVTVTVTITCPFGTASPVSKILVTVSYNTPQQVISNATYATSNGLVMNLDAGNSNSISQNVFPYPTNIYSWVTSANNATLSRDTISSPVGNTPLKMVVTGNDPYTLSYNSAAFNLAPTTVGKTWTISVWAKIDASTPIRSQLLLLGGNSSGGYTENGSTYITLTPNWQRFSYTYTTTNATTAYIQARLDGTDSSGAGGTIWWDGLQVEQGGSMTNFNPTPITTWTDLSGNGNNGTLMNNVGYTVNNSGALTFDGINDYVSVGNLGTFYNKGTISFWINPSVVEDYRNPFTTNYNGGSPNNSGIRFEESTAGSLSVVIGNDAGTFSGAMYLSSGFLANNWYHVVLVWNTSTNNINGYLNGVKEFDQSQTLWPTTMPAVTIGEGFSSTRYWKGYISNVQIYNRALSATEIQQDFNNLRGRYDI